MENLIKTLDNTVFRFSPFFHSKKDRRELEKVKKRITLMIEDGDPVLCWE